jgi:HSP20 family protein
MARRGEKSGDTGTTTGTTGASGGSGGGTALEERPRGGRAARRRGFGPAAMGGMGLTRPGIPPSPWELMGRMSEELTQLFDSIGGAGTAASRGQTGIASTARSRGTGTEGATAAPVLLIPNIEVLQRSGALVVRADLPGLDADEIDVSVDNGMLVISGERTQQQQDESDGFVRSEVLYGAFYRAIPLPDGADEDNIVAAVSKGVLEVIVPVSERDVNRRVQVRNAEGEKSGSVEADKNRTAESGKSRTAEGGRSGTNA